ncbi:MAG: hypothetical protein NDF55_07280 [archaeon GB-1867-005]|nr:hypothetical protein [Candidatus Culexmicrobium cathedralense]
MSKNKSRNEYKLIYFVPLIIVLIGVVAFFIVNEILKPKIIGEVVEELSLTEIIPTSHEEAIKIMPKLFK